MTGIERFEDYERKLREKYGAPGLVFTVSGLSGVGKSTLSRFLARELNLELISTGKFFREEAKKRDMDIVDFTKNIQKIEEKEGVDFDIMWEKKTLELAFKRDKILIQGRLSGVILHDIAPVRIFIECDRDVIADRVAQRENVSTEEALKGIKERDKELQRKFEKKYGVDPTKRKYYNVIIDNSGDLKETKENLMNKVNKVLSGKDVEI